MSIANGREVSRDGDELLPIGQVAAMVALSRRTISRLADAGKLPPPLRIGGSLRWRLADVRQWIAAGCPAARNISGGSSR
jgi:excisionase family DNA binding protein